MSPSKIKGGEKTLIVTRHRIETDYIDIRLKMLGENVDIGWHSTVWADAIGDNTRIGRFCEIQEGVKIGKNVKVGSYSFICEGVTIDNNVFIGPRCTFTNDKYIHWPDKGTWKPETTIVHDGVKIGAGAIILPNVEIHEGVVIGAGSVVTKSLSGKSLFVGNPARYSRDYGRNKRGWDRE